LKAEAGTGARQPHYAIYRSTIVLLGIYAVLCSTLKSMPLWPNSQLALSFAILTIIYTIASFCEVTLAHQTRFNVAFPLLIAVLVGWGAVYAMWMVWPAMLLSCWRKKSDIVRAAFNIAQLQCSAWVAGLGFHAAGGQIGSVTIKWSLLPLLVAIIGYDVVNCLLVSGAVALERNQPFSDTARRVLWEDRKLALPFHFGMSLLSSLMFHGQGWPGLVLLCLVLFGLHYLFALPTQIERHRAASLTDGMTGLWNYRFFNEWAAGEGTEWLERRRQFAFMFADVDGLKAINDMEGHIAGDTAIRAMGSMLGSVCRRDDRVIRYAGDEFLAILPGIGRSEAVRVAKRFVSRLEAATAELPRFTVSLGIAAFPEDAASIEDLLVRADQAAYHAKRRPGNTISAALSSDRGSSHTSEFDQTCVEVI